MNDQLKTFLDTFLCSLVRFRMLGSEQRGDYHDWSAWGRLRGRLACASELRLITSDQEKLLSGLIDNADIYKGHPFPDERNAGPFITWWELHKRNVSTHLLEKPQAVPGNEPVKLQPVAACRELRLLCLLVTSRDGQARSLPVHTLRPVPPIVCPTRTHAENGSRRWCLDALADPVANNPGLYLRETYAKRPPAEVLERCGKHRQASALRPAVRALSVGRVTA